MGNINRYISAYIVITVLTFISNSFAQQDPIEEKEVVQEKAQFKIENVQKPGLFTLPDAFAPVNSVMEEKEKKLFLLISDISEGFFKDAVKLNNPYIRKPVAGSMFVNSIQLKIRKPRYKPVSWKLFIISPEMDTIKIFEGKGKIPDKIVWDGRTPSGVLKLLTPYSVLLKYRDEYGRMRRVYQGDIMVTGFKFEKDGEYFAIFAVDSMFEKGSDKLNNRGRIVIEEMANLIKENYREELKILLRAPTGFLYAKRKDVIEKEFRKRLPYHEGKASVVQEFIGREEIPTLGIGVR